MRDTCYYSLVSKTSYPAWSSRAMAVHPLKSLSCVKSARLHLSAPSEGRTAGQWGLVKWHEGMSKGEKATARGDSFKSANNVL